MRVYEGDRKELVAEEHLMGEKVEHNNKASEASQSVSNNLVKSILLVAEEYIHGERVKTYGSPTETFPEIARVASLITGKLFTAEDICLIQVALKLIRQKYSPTNPDHITDACGYLGILHDIRVTEAGGRAGRTGGDK